MLQWHVVGQAKSLRQTDRMFSRKEEVKKRIEADCDAVALSHSPIILDSCGPYPVVRPPPCPSQAGYGSKCRKLSRCETPHLLPGQAVFRTVQV